MRQLVATVTANGEVGPGVVRMRLALPDGTDPIAPGQFLMVRPLRADAPLLRRPFGVMAVDEEGCDILFDLRGPGTRALAAARPGDELDVLLPLGRGFPLPDPGQTAVLVAGGTGLPPLLHLGRYLREHDVPLAFRYGAADADRLVLREAVRAIDPAAGLATDDGSHGHRGPVTELLPPAAADLTFYAVGPVPMLRAVAAAAVDRPCWVSLEERMACGTGVCMGCAVPLAGGGTARVCVEGPVFAAGELAWTWD